MSPCSDAQPVVRRAWLPGETKAEPTCPPASAPAVVAPLGRMEGSRSPGRAAIPGVRTNRYASSVGMALTEVGLRTKRVAQASCAAPTCTTSIAPVQTLPAVGTSPRQPGNHPRAEGACQPGRNDRARRVHRGIQGRRLAVSSSGWRSSRRWCSAYRHPLDLHRSAGEPKHLRVRASALDKPGTSPRARRGIGARQLPDRSELLRLRLSRRRGHRERECDNDSGHELTGSRGPRSSRTSLKSWCSDDHRGSFRRWPDPGGRPRKLLPRVVGETPGMLHEPAGSRTPGPDPSSARTLAPSR